MPIQKVLKVKFYKKYILQIKYHVNFFFSLLYKTFNVNIDHSIHH